VSSIEKSTNTLKLNYPADELRTPVNVLAPDTRNFNFSISSIDVLYQSIEHIQLNSSVPNDIRVQFDTARNLFLHSFYVYRFYVVAESQALATLEFALRDCIGEEEIKSFNKELKAQKRGFSKGLRLYMEYLANRELIKNEDFPIWHGRNRIAAEEAHRANVLKIMKDKGLSEYTWDDSEIDESKFDVEWNYVEVLCNIIPKIRNNYAHGSSTLHNQVLHSFENISIIINKMYERTPSRKSKSSKQ
jgi:hypothetical protein